MATALLCSTTPLWNPPGSISGSSTSSATIGGTPLACNLRAAELNPATEQPAWWNAGIAATALREWPTALKAWHGYGIELPDAPTPFEYDLGIAPVRVNPVEKPEVVWGRRLDPARIRILNVPLPDSSS